MSYGGKPLHASGNTTNTVTITIAAVSDVEHTVNHVSASLDTDATDVANTWVTVESPANTVLWKAIISKAGPAPINFPSDGVRGASGQALLVKLNGADDITGYLNAIQVS